MELATFWMVIAVGGIVAVFWMDMQARIARIEHKVNLLLQHSGIDTVKNPQLSNRVKEIARDPARKIEAIKAYREETGAGLAEAKQAVELYMNSL